MRSLVRLLGGTLAALALLATLGVGHALAAQQTTLTTFSGTTSGSGTWTRTITDITEPGSPGRASVQTTYPVPVNWTPGMTAAQVALAYQNACNATLPGPLTGANGYGTARDNVVLPRVRLSKQLGTYNFADTPFPTGITVETHVPANAEDAPITSTAGLAGLVTALAALAYLARRKRSLA